MGLFQFETVGQNDLCRLGDIYRLRYKVYVDEWQFEKPEDHPEGIETDMFDHRAIQIAAVRKVDSKVVGTVRLIQDFGEGFPIEQHMVIERGPSPEKRNRTVEISRLCVTHEFNRRAEDHAIHNDDYMEASEQNVREREKRDPQNDVVMGLIRALTRESRENQIKYWFVAMAKGLNILLRRKGIVFEPAGPEVDYHGLRRPYFGEVSRILQKNEELSRIFHGDEA